MTQDDSLPHSTVTIGMPVYNGAISIHRALDTLLAQTFQDFQLIISDNASTDQTEQICRKYEKQDPRIKYVRQQSNIGAINNFKYVVTTAKSEFFMFAAHDDEWDPEFLDANLIGLRNRRGICASFCNVLCVNERGERLKIVKFDGDALELKSRYSLIRGALRQNKLNFFIYGVFKTEVLKKYFAKEINFIDRWFLIAAAIDGHRFAHIKKTMYRRQISTGDISVKHKFSSDLNLLKSVLHLIAWLREVTDKNHQNRWIFIFSFVFASKFVLIKLMKKRFKWFVMRIKP
jgi:glycosyltransferase involved in cell wall biosynthesis